MAKYDSLFYQNQSRGSRNSARVVVPIISELVQPGSVLDVGCGAGTWLAEWARQGVTDFVGLDGDYVDRGALQIDPGNFVPTDLAKRFSLQRKFDLVECLEVAEHLDESCAGQLIECLTSHGDVVLFSAAIPGQRGRHHVNEQWPSYWVEKFSTAGFKAYDVVRPLIWADPNVVVWYRQNILVFARARAFNTIDTIDTRIDLVHPETWQARLDYQPSAGRLLHALLNSLMRSLRRRLGLADKAILRDNHH